MANIGIDILSMPTVTNLNGSEWVPVVQGGTNKRIQSGVLSLSGLAQVFPAGIDYVMGSVGGALATGVFGAGVIVPFNCSITQSVLNGNVNNASAVVDIWKCTEAQFDGGLTHPVAGDSITAAARPTIVNSNKATDSNLVGWTTILTQGDVLWYNIVSVIGFTSLTLALKCQRTLP